MPRIMTVQQSEAFGRTPSASDAALPAGRTVEDILSAMLSAEALSRAELVARESGERIEAVVTRLGMVSEAALADRFAGATGLVRLFAADLPAEAVAGPELAPAFLHDMRLLPVARDGDALTVAMANPFDGFALEAMRFAFGLPVRAAVATASDIESAIDRLYRPAGAGEAAVDASVDDEDLAALKDLVSDAPVIRAVNRLIARAVDERASDIHLEPTDDALTVRFRIDGVLRAMPPLPAAMRQPLVSRVKIMADLDIAERRLPQDGRMRVAVRGHEIDLRVATAPSMHGESVVMRILDKSRVALDFATLGFDDALADELREGLHKPHGIMLVTGPTGSGKTTTLYAALAELNSATTKLLTVEDPVEYRLAGVVQTQVNPAIGFTFGSALRSFLRQDPDVIMVGEIRDRETAQIAVQAALTGHMILSTLHTNTAAGAVTRLIDMEVEPFLLASVLTGVLAQRLVRRLCPHCREAAAPDIAHARALARLGADRLPERLWRAVGCPACGDTGYQGRVAILEYLPVTDAVAAAILARAETREVQAAAPGMRTLLSDGLVKAGQGLTTVEEVLRVASGD